MKYNIIKKTFLAVALLFIPSIMVADKIEIQDSTVIVVGKGQTNKKGVFTSTADTIRFDSIFIDEIVLTYKGRERQTLSVVDSVLNQSLFSQDVTNGMSKGEMKDLSFSLLAGHIYIIQHGKGTRWRLSIPTPHISKNNDLASDSTKTDSVGIEENIEGKAENSIFSWLLYLICLIVVCIVGYSLYRRLRTPKDKEQEHFNDNEKADEKEDTETKTNVDEKDSKVTENTLSENNVEKAILIAEAEKGKKRLKRLKDIALLLGLKEDQLPLIEVRINALKDKANQKQNADIPFVVENTKPVVESKDYEDIYAVQNEVAKELLRKFEQRSIFADSINRAKQRCYVKEPKESEILHYLIDEIAKTLRSLNNQIESALGKSLEPVDDTIVLPKSESHTEWLYSRLKDLFNFSCDEKASVRQNLEQLICERTVALVDRKALEEATPNIEIEKVVEEKLTKAKVDWEADAKQDKENALAVKETEIDGLKRQIETKNSIITNLEGQINDAISEKEQIIINKDSVISEKTQIISDRDSELQELKDRHKQELQTEVETLVGKLHQFTNAIEWRPMLDPCNNDDATLNQCTDIESRLSEKLREMKERLTGFATVENAVPEETRIAIQSALTSEITIDESVVNSLCRLFAYSNLAFMTDMKREYGVRLRRKNIHEVYEALENLYIQFGIKFQIPPLFVMESKDGDYENVTGQAYSELGNLCPNVSNHCDNIDSDMRLKDVIVDIDKIGYAIDGSVQRNARILTF